MSLREFYEWHVFSQSHPFPADIIDAHGAMQLALLANINRDPKVHAAYDPADFMQIRDRTNNAPAPAEAHKMTIAQRMRSVISSGG